jgi:hypothetical protein
LIDEEIVMDRMECRLPDEESRFPRGNASFLSCFVDRSERKATKILGSDAFLEMKGAFLDGTWLCSKGKALSSTGTWLCSKGKVLSSTGTALGSR